MSMNM